MIPYLRSLHTPRQQLSAAIFISCVLLVMRIVYLTWFSPYGLAPDEAQYWHWLMHNNLAFATKPALTTWLMGASTAVFGNGLVGVKAFALVGQAALPVLGMALAFQVFKSTKAAWLTYALLTTSPVVAAGGLIMAPDALTTPLWLAALLVLTYALPHKTLPAKHAVLMGVLIGLAGLAKYSAALFFPLLFLYVVFFKREWLKSPWLYGAGAVALALQAPTLIWNIQNNWAGLYHLLWQADGGGDTRHGGLHTLADFLGGQALVLGPVALISMAFAWFIFAKRSPTNNHQPLTINLLWWFTFPLFAVFLLQTTGAKVQPNWPILATIPAMVLASGWLASKHGKVAQGLIILGLVFSSTLSLALYNTHMLRAVGIPLKLKTDPTKDLLGWPELGSLIGQMLPSLQSNTVLLASRYQTVAALAYHVPQARAGAVPVLYLNSGGRRSNQYDFWDWPSLNNTLVVYVAERPELPLEVQSRFKTCQPWQRVQVAGHGLALRQASLFLCWGAGAPPQSTL